MTHLMYMAHRTAMILLTTVTFLRVQTITLFHHMMSALSFQLALIYAA